MELKQIRKTVAQLDGVKSESKRLGEDLEQQFAELLGGGSFGADDPVLTSLLGDQLAEIVRRTQWSSLVINPGSTSTKVAIYNGLKLVAADDIHLNPDQPDGIEQRSRLIEEWIRQVGLDVTELTGIAARGGFLAPVPAATYRITDAMRRDLETPPLKHASNMAVPIAQHLAKRGRDEVILTTTDPVTCDEIDAVYRITGSKKIITDGTALHYLNLRGIARLTEKLLGVEKGEIHLAAAHMGGGMSAARYLRGRMVQVLNAFGNLPSANRCGRLPLKDLIQLMEKRKYTLEDLKKDVVEAGGGLLSLAGTNDFKALFTLRDKGATPEQKQKIDLLTEFYATRVAAALMELASCEQPLDILLLTGGLAYSNEFCDQIARRIPLPIPLVRVPGSIESQALVAGLLRTLVDKDSRRDYAKARDALAATRAEEQKLLDTPIFQQPVFRAKSSSPLSSLDKIVAAAMPEDDLPTIAIIGADNEEALLAAKLANKEGSIRLARFVLIGPYGAVSELAWELDVPIDDENYFIVDAENTIETAMDLLSDGIVDTLMKGNITTAGLLKGYFVGLKKSGKLPRGVMLSHLGLFQLPGRPKYLAVTDAAINPHPSLEARIAILENALAALHTLGISKPKVAVISATEKPSDKVQSSMEGKEIASRLADRKDLIIDGPVSVDLALSPASAEEKRYQGRIMGDADLLLVPTLDVGNAVYKSFTVAGGATTAGVVIGGDVPLILTSRGDSSQSKFSSIALALVLAKRSKGGSVHEN